MSSMVKIDREKTIFDILYSKQACLNKKTSVSKTHKIGIFARGLVHGFGQKFENCERFVLCKIHPEKVFGDVLVRKQAFLDNIHMDLKRRQN